MRMLAPKLSAMKPRVTIKDVARHAEASPTTVSHVLSGKGRVSGATKKRVERAVQELGYQPHPAARSLRTARFDSIGLLFPERATSLEFYSDLAMGAARAAFDSGKSITLIPPDASVEEIVAMSIDAVVVADPLVGDSRLSGFGERMPVVVCEKTDESFPAVDLGHERLMEGLLHHFVQQGARRVCLLRPPTTVWWGRRVDEGVAAWKRDHPLVDVQVCQMPFVATADEVTECLDMALSQRPDALFVAQEGVAPLVLGAAEAHGVRVPEDMLLAVGVDGRDARFSPVPVTALDLAARECGELAVRLTEDPGVRSVAVPSRLVVRRSSSRHTGSEGASA